MQKGQGPLEGSSTDGLGASDVHSQFGNLPPPERALTSIQALMWLNL